MENASKALLMAGGILVGVLILALMITLFISSSKISSEYDNTKQITGVQQFNVNFTKYLGQDLTIHQVITITNFANQNNVSISGISGGKTTSDISEDTLKKVYKLTIDTYDENGYITKIQIN